MKKKINVNCIKQSSLHKNTRIINPDSMITMEFIKDRINLYIDDHNIVIKLLDN